MQRLQSILVGVDLHHGSRIASPDLEAAPQAALAQAVELALNSGALLTLCAVLDVSAQAQHLIEVDHAHLQRCVEDAARAALEEVAQPLRDRGVRVETILRFGASWEELTRQAIAGKHDLLLVGTRSRGSAARFLFGSTSQKLLRSCPIPVWVAKPGEIREIREIAVATDFSDAALQAVHAAVAVARAINAKLFVLHALEFPFEAYLRTAGVAEEEVAKYRTRLRAEAEEHLGAQLAQTDYRTLPHGVKAEVIEGPADTVIPQFVSDNAVDLLVIGTHGRTGLTRMLLGNTAERLLPHLHASLLAIRPADFESPVAPTA